MSHVLPTLGAGGIMERPSRQMQNQLFKKGVKTESSWLSHFSHLSSGGVGGGSRECWEDCDAGTATHLAPSPRVRCLISPELVVPHPMPHHESGQHTFRLLKDLGHHVTWCHQTGIAVNPIPRQKGHNPRPAML